MGAARAAGCSLRCLAPARVWKSLAPASAVWISGAHSRKPRPGDNPPPDAAVAPTTRTGGGWGTRGRGRWVWGGGPRRPLSTKSDGGSLSLAGQVVDAAAQAAPGSLIDAHAMGLMEEEERRWLAAEQEGCGRDLFQQWCAWDGYEDARMLFGSLPYPPGYWEQLEEVNERVLAPHGLRSERPLLLALAFMGPSFPGNKATQQGRRVRARTSAVLHHGNKGLELLGDTTLKAGVTEHVLGAESHRAAKVKDLALQRAMLENNEALGVLALEGWGLGSVMLSGDKHTSTALAMIFRGGGEWSPGMLRGEAVDFREKEKALVWAAADCVEALIGAVAIERGMGVAAAFVRGAVVPQLEEVAAGGTLAALRGEQGYNPIAEFQHVVLSQSKDPPIYTELDRKEQRDGTRWFRVSLCAFGRIVAIGEGSNKREARRDAATKALKMYPFPGGGEGDASAVPRIPTGLHKILGIPAVGSD